MVKKLLLLLLLGAFFFIIGCNVDLLGIFSANDLDERLKERNNLKFLDDRLWSSLPHFGSEYSFIVLTDTHIENGNSFGLEALADVITDNNTDLTKTKIEFMVILGDITQDGAEKDINEFIRVADLFTIPCYPVAGNHDVYFDNWSVWKDKIGSTSYRIDGNDITLFILDSANSFFGKDQLDWLEREIKTTGGTPNARVFVFTHSPLFVEGPVGMQQITDTKERARIASILKNRCDIMFMGHSHKYYYNEAGNVKYITIEDYVVAKVYCIVTVKPEGITYNFYKL
ncbi:MAG: metallophosphoesterase [Treponema sp.]|nr:metallophosphoesterase [Treponema sp.]